MPLVRYRAYCRVFLAPFLVYNFAIISSGKKNLNLMLTLGSPMNIIPWHLIILKLINSKTVTISCSPLRLRT